MAMGMYTQNDITIDIAEVKRALDSFEKDPTILADKRVRKFRDFLQGVNAKLPLSAYYPIPFECKVVVPDLCNCDALKIRGLVLGDKQTCSTISRIKQIMAQHALDNGRREEAISHLNEAILADPVNLTLLGMRGKTFIKMRKPVAALSDAEKMLAIKENMVTAHLIGGYANSMIGEWDKALESFSFCHGVEDVPWMNEKIQQDREKLNAYLKLVQHNETFMEGVDWFSFTWLCKNTPHEIFDSLSFSFVVDYLRSLGVNVKKLMKPKLPYGVSSDDDDDDNDELKNVRVPTEAELSKAEEPVEMESSSRDSVEESIKAELINVEEPVEMASLSQGSVEESIKAEVSAVEEPVEIASSRGGTVKTLVQMYADKIDAAKILAGKIEAQKKK